VSLELIRTIDDMRAWIRSRKIRDSVIGLVPTMGALHAGHISLIERARRECRTVVVSIFVNPIQFNQAEDYDRYPRTADSDLAACEAARVDAVFMPPVGEMYAEALLTSVEVARISEGLCGAFRPGHFRGVATVVAKLFNIVQPDRAYFGEKDAQQLAVIARMARDLSMPVEIVPVETVREADGLALSSRNARLSPAERRVAPIVYRALCTAAESMRAFHDVKAAERSGLELLAREPSVRVEYFALVDANTMQPPGPGSRTLRIAAAVWLGDTRLIDNVRVDLESAEAGPALD
jgi:pantoate--beta-alanine ligase